MCRWRYARGSCFLHKLLAHANMPLRSVAGFSSSSEWSRRLVPLGLNFHGDLEFWRWIVEVGMDASEGAFHAHVSSSSTPAMLDFNSVRVKHAVGGFCEKTGQYWLYDSYEETCMLLVVS